MWRRRWLLIIPAKHKRTVLNQKKTTVNASMRKFFHHRVNFINKRTTIECKQSLYYQAKNAANEMNQSVYYQAKMQKIRSKWDELGGYTYVYKLELEVLGFRFYRREWAGFSNLISWVSGLIHKLDLRTRTRSWGPVYHMFGSNRILSSWSNHTPRLIP